MASSFRLFRYLGWPLGGVLLLILLPAAASPRGFEAAVLAELDVMRADPAGYVDWLFDYRDHIDGLIARGEGDDPDFQTREGVRAVDEAISVMRRAAPLPQLAESRLLALAAADHVAAQSRSGGVGHISNGRNPSSRVVAHGGGPYVAEVITYGHTDPMSVIRQLLVDDGVPQRGHRKTLLSGEYRYAGVACGSHPAWRTMCVIDLSQTPDGSAPPPPRRATP